MSLVPLSEVCDITAGQSAPQDSDAFGPEGHPFIRAGSLDALTNGGRENDCEHLTEEKAQQYRMRLFPKDTIVFAKSGMSAKIGRVYRLKAPAYIVSHLAAVTPGKDVAPSYLQRWFERNPPSRLIPNEAYPSIRTSEIGALKIELPKKSEQKRIAAILDKADEIRRKRQQAIQLADEFLRSVFLYMFGDPVTNPKGWKRHECKNLCRQITVGIVVKPASYYVDAGVPALRSLNVRPNRIEQNNFVFFSEEDNAGRLAKTRVFEGDIVLVRSGQPGTAAVVPASLDGVNAIDILIARPKQDCVDSVFLAHFFNSPGGRALVLKEERGQIQKHLNVGSLNEAQIPLPPLQEQEKFRKIVERVSLLKQKYDRSDYEELFAALSQRAFQGGL